MLIRRALACAVLLTVPSALAAQEQAELCRDLQQQPTVGKWASYSFTGGRSDGSTMRMAIVSTEARGDSSYYWYEMAINNPRQGNVVIQLLVPGLGYQMGTVRGMVMKSGNEPAMRMPDQMVSMMGSRLAPNIAAEVARNCQASRVVGWESVTVPAGEFRSLHVQTEEGGDAWVLKEQFGVVKAVMKDGTVMQLTGRGSDAKSSITETPRSMMGQ